MHIAFSRQAMPEGARGQKANLGKTARAILVCGLLSPAAVMDVSAGQWHLPNPAGMNSAFGTSVTVLPNGNIVVTDPGYDTATAQDVGAVYLYDGSTLEVISILTGSTPDDRIASGGRGGDSEGVILVGDGNFLVWSPVWDNGPAVDAGAVTWCSGTSGLSGEVGAGNSLVGRTANDGVGGGGGDFRHIIGLPNGHYLVLSPGWDNGTAVDAGAVTWGNRNQGVTGEVGSINSLVGTSAQDLVGLLHLVAILADGNYVVGAPSWDNGAATDAGAVTWGSGTTGITGEISAANSLVGSAASNLVGSVVATALANGHYVVCSPDWDDDGPARVGAVTWGNGITGTRGEVSARNSLVGQSPNDVVGSGGVTALVNGHYVVMSAFWDNGAIADVGAVTWGDGRRGISGKITPENSLVGRTALDRVGIEGPGTERAVTALVNGNYVVVSWRWARGSVVDAGAATWGHGDTGVVGFISTDNSLVGQAPGDQLGSYGVTPLANGHYVVSSPDWDSGDKLDVGAATWGNGERGTIGLVSRENSLVGVNSGDRVGVGGVKALLDGNYVVISPDWDNIIDADVGAVTWGDGSTGVRGSVLPPNSLIGTTPGDQVGSGGVTALANGNYVVASPEWSNGSANVGAATWGSGRRGVVGEVSPANSLVPDQGSAFGHSLLVTALTNGNYVVSSRIVQLAGVGLILMSGTVTWGSGVSGIAGEIDASNSLVDSRISPSFEANLTALPDGHYAVNSDLWADTYEGAISLCDGTGGTTGEISTANSVLGSAPDAGPDTVFDYDVLRSRLVVGSPGANRVSLFSYIPDIEVTQGPNDPLINGGTSSLGAPVGAEISRRFVLRNANAGDLTGLGITIDGADATMFSVTESPVAPIGPFVSSTFTLRFAPTTPGLKGATLHIFSNDPDEHPFDINLSGQVLVATDDSDGDGMNDVTEFELAAMGFDWEESQPGLVDLLFASANGAGLYTTNQIQALNTAVHSIQADPVSGRVTLTLGVHKSTSLLDDFTPFPMSAPQTLINAQGELEFEFIPTDGAAFFLLEAE